MNNVIERLTEVLAASPDPVLSSGSIGVKKPSDSGDIPAIVMSIAINGAEGVGIGGFIRSGDTVVKSSTVVEVSIESETFSSGLKSLHLWPLPLKKNPSSLEKEYTGNDIQVRKKGKGTG